MISCNKVENRIIPYEMVLEAISTTNELVDRILPEKVVPSLKIGTKYIKRVLKSLIRKADEGLPIIGHHLAFQSEYLSCFDCVPVCFEGTSYLLSALLPNGVEYYNDIITSYGHPFHTCSSQKGVMGMMLDDLFRFDAIITPTAPCDNTYASYQFFAYKNIPLILPDLPTLQGEKSYRYYGEQIKIALEKLGAIIGQEPDFEKMRKHLENENKSNLLQLELFDLRKAKPCPVDNLFNAMAAAAAVFLNGTPEKVSFLEDYLKIAKERYTKQNYNGKEEKVRCIWPFMLIFFSLELCEWLNREIGMSILFDIFNYNFSELINVDSNLESLFYQMAKRNMNLPMLKQSVEFYYPFIKTCIHLAKDFQADCFIITSHIGCKQFGAIAQVLREALKDEVGIPLLNIELDVGDKRITSVKMIKDKINTFTNTLL